MQIRDIAHFKSGV